MRIKLGSNTERREKNYYPSVSTSPLKLYFNGRNKSKVPPGTEQQVKHRSKRARGATKAPKYNDGEAEKSRLTLDFVGVGLLAPRHRGEDDDGGGVDDDDDDDERRGWWMIKGG